MKIKLEKEKNVVKQEIQQAINRLEKCLRILVDEDEESNGNGYSRVNDCIQKLWKVYNDLD